MTASMRSLAGSCRKLTELFVHMATWTASTIKREGFAKRPNFFSFRKQHKYRWTRDVVKKNKQILAKGKEEEN